MELFIDNDSKVEDISKLFTARYPYLKIEFYKRNFANTSLKKEVIPFHIPLAKVIKKNLKVVINLKSNMTVEELENDFLVIGLQAEVFRKSGKVWVETSLTTTWTLQQQNLAGEEISRHY